MTRAPLLGILARQGHQVARSAHRALAGLIVPVILLTPAATAACGTLAVDIKPTVTARVRGPTASVPAPPALDVAAPPVSVSSGLSQPAREVGAIRRFEYSGLG